MNKKYRSIEPKSQDGGLPDLLIAIKGESLTKTIAVKVWPSLIEWLNDGVEASRFIRSCIIEKLERLSDAPNPAVCGECNFLRRESPFFCPKINAFIDEGALSQPWDCEEFSPRREEF